jgi:hypothetical protein
MINMMISVKFDAEFCSFEERYGFHRGVFGLSAQAILDESALFEVIEMYVRWRDSDLSRMLQYLSEAVFYMHTANTVESLE